MRKRLLGLVAVLMGGMMGMMSLATVGAVEAHAADSKCVETSILGNKSGGKKYCESEDGQGVYDILDIILTVLTFGVGIAAAIGLTICGIQYATSGQNEAKATQARRRIFEIVIGIIAYAVLWAALKFLLPGGVDGTGG